jgi:predicted peptidase
VTRAGRQNRRRLATASAVVRAAIGLFVAATAATAHADPSDAPPPVVTTVAAPSSRPAATQPTTAPFVSPVAAQTAIDVLGDRPLPTAPGDHKLRFRTRIGNQPVDMACLLHLPPDYASAGPDAKHPMLVFLHGSGETGTDLAGVYIHGPMSLLKADGGNPDFAATCPFVVLCPQCPPRGQRWDMDYMTAALKVLIDGVVGRARVDPDRVYLTGLSMGGLGTWCVAEADAGRFAAIAPMNGQGCHPEQAGPLLRTVPVWSAVGLNDEAKFVEGTRAMDLALAHGPAERRFSYLIGNGHDAFWPTYQDPDFYEWLLNHRRAAAPPPATAPPFDANDPPTAPGRHFCTMATHVGDQACQLDYVLTLPKGYEPGKRYPTLLFLREADTVGPDYGDVCVHGPELALARDPALAADCPFVIVSPHWPAKCDWQSPGMTTAVLGLLDHLSAIGVGIDLDRVSVTGVNAGANGAWRLVADAPDRFAAVVPVETNVPIPSPDEQLSAVLRAVPGRAYVPATDRASADRLARLGAGSPREWRTVPLPPSAAPLGDLPPYADRELFAWLARQTRPVPQASVSTK